jgi:hypothetical protein
MMSDKNKALAQELGLDKLPEEQQQIQLDKFHEILEARVGIVVEQVLTDVQIVEFTKVAESENADVAKAWLMQKIPAYDEIVSEQMVALKQEIVENSALIREGISRASN